MTTIYDAARQLARALDRAAAEHGVPNTFSMGELYAHHGGPEPKLAGRALAMLINCELPETCKASRMGNGRIDVSARVWTCDTRDACDHPLSCECRHGPGTTQCTHAKR